MQEESAEVIRDFLSFLYRHADFKLHEDNWLSLMKLAHKVGLIELVNACDRYAAVTRVSMTLEVFQSSFGARHIRLFERSSRGLVASLAKHKTSAQYLSLPLRLRLLASVMYLVLIHNLDISQGAFTDMSGPPCFLSAPSIIHR